MRQVIILGLIVALGYLLTQLLIPKRRGSGHTGAQASQGVIEEMVQDPFCHTYLPPSQAIRRSIRSREYFFCSPGCLEKFLARHP